MADQQVAALPFVQASRISERSSFIIANLALAPAAPVTAPSTPVQIPAVGYLRKIRMELTAAITGGGSATYNADAPWNVINSVAFKNSAGQNLIAPLTGYELYVYNKWGNIGRGLSQGVGPTGDPRFGRQFSASTTAFHFFLDVPFEVDPTTALGAIPATASNRSYQLEINFAAIATVFGGTAPTAVALTVDATAIYWDTPVSTTPGGVTQETDPVGAGTVVIVQKEASILPAGEMLTRINNTGNIIRQLIFIQRTAAGVRSDSDWTGVFELFVDNNPLLRLKKTEWEDAMAAWYNYGAAAKDVMGGLDTGVYVLPFDMLIGSLGGDPENSRAQLLPTLDATLLQAKGYSWGTSGNTLTVIVQSVTGAGSDLIFAK